MGSRANLAHALGRSTRGQRRHDVLQMHVADDLVGARLDQGIARVLIGSGQLHILVERSAFLQYHDVPAQGHHMAGHPVGVVEHAVDEPPRAGVQVHVLQNQAQFVGRVQHLGTGGRPQAQRAQEEIGRGGQRPDEGEGHEVEDAQGRGGPQRNRLRPLQRDRFGHQLAQHRVQEADEYEAYAQRQRLDRESGPAAEGSEMGLDEGRHGWFAEPAKS